MQIELSADHPPTGLILDNYARGRRRAVWISTSSDLHFDAQRDLRDLGCAGIPVINNCQVCPMLSCFWDCCDCRRCAQNLLVRMLTCLMPAQHSGPSRLQCSLMQALDKGTKALGLSKDLKEGVLFM